MLLNRLRNRRTEEGAAAVEAAIITPLFLLLIFAIMEFGPVFLVWSGVKAASKDGAREASSSGQDAYSDFNILDTIRRTSRVNNLEYVMVFKGVDCTPALASSCGVHSAVPVACKNAALIASPGVAGLCNIYYPADLTKTKDKFGYHPTNNPLGVDFNYPALDRKDYTTGPPDFVGVYVQSAYASPTGIVGDRKISETTVMQVEARRAVG